MNYIVLSFRVIRVVAWPVLVAVTSTERILTFPFFIFFASVLLTVIAGLEIVI